AASFSAVSFDLLHRSPVRIELTAVLSRNSRSSVIFQCGHYGSKPQIPYGLIHRISPDTGTMDKLAGLREILALDPKNSFARYGIAMELASQGKPMLRFRNLIRSWPPIPITLQATSCLRRP
ncbi:MAG: hypothetical protein WDM87_13540, partial [Terracidiphilus sp.]